MPIENKNYIYSLNLIFTRLGSVIETNIMF